MIINYNYLGLIKSAFSPPGRHTVQSGVLFFIVDLCFADDRYHFSWPLILGLGLYVSVVLSHIQISSKSLVCGL